MPTTSPPTILELDPAKVAVHPSNARRKLRGIPELAASIKAQGQLVPATVVPLNGDGTYQLVFGHRRLAACALAEMPLFAVLREDWTEAQAQVLAQLGENEARDDLSTAERARAVQTALSLGIEAEVVAEASSLPAEQIAQVATVADSAVATGLAERHDLSLDQALVMVEFDGDKEALKVLTQTAVGDPRYWDHTVGRLRRQRADHRAVTAALDAAKADGAKVLTEADRKAKTPRARIEELTDSGDKELTQARHRKCPGRSVGVVDNYGDHRVVEYCEDPAAHGHKRRGVGRPGQRQAPDTRTQAQKEAETAERRRVIANNKAMDAANGVRREWVKGLLKRRAAVPGLAAFVASEILRRPGMLDRVDVETWEDVTGLKRQPSAVGGHLLPSVAEPALKACRSDRDFLTAALGLVVACYESAWSKEAWRGVHAGRAAYLAFLEGAGYALAEVEQLIPAAVAEEEAKRARRRQSAKAAK